MITTRRVLAALFMMATVALVASPVAAQTSSDESSSAVPRLADGRPDLNGVWDFRTITPLERPAEFGEKAFLTAEEAAELTAASVRVDRAPGPGEVGAYNQFWYDQGAAVIDGRRTSLLFDPPDGRIPPLVPGTRHQIGSYGEDILSARPVRYRGGGSNRDSHEDRGLAERCLLGFNAGPPVLPAGYNQNIQVFVNDDHVVLLHEMVHDTRIVPLDGRPHISEDIRQWMGNSRGYWDGDTLVIETKNFNDKIASFNDTITSAMGSGTTLHLTERLRRVDVDTLEYEFTINDPTVFTRPFSGMIPMKRNADPVYEYACHEGNYGLPDILAGARVEEQAPGATITGSR